MKRAFERIGPLVPALATVGASICVSSLLLAPGPQTPLGPHPVVPSFTTKVGHVVAALSPPAQPRSRRRGLVAPSPVSRSLSATAPRSATSTANLHPSLSQVGRLEAPPASPSPPAPSSPPSPPAAPPVTPQPAPEPVTQAPTQNEKRPKDGSRPGWGHGDPNHDHTGPPGQASKGQKNNQTTVAPAAPVAPVPPAAPGDQHAPHQNGEKKSPGH